MQAGKLNKRVTIQKPVRSKDPDYGDFKTDWVDVSDVWASIEPLSAREFIAAQAAQSEVVARIVIRHRKDIDSTMRILHKDKIYNIKGVLPDKETGLEYITLPVSEGVNDGS